MMAHSRVIFSKEVNGKAIARHWIRKTGYMLEKGLEYRLKNPEKNQFTDIYYPELKDNPMGKYGIHEYLLEDFGVEKEDILEHAKSYRRIFM